MRARLRSYAALSVSAAVVASLLAACSGGSSGSSSTPSAAKVVVQLDGPLKSYDPAQGSSFQDGVALSSMYDPLVDFDPGGKIVPGLASSWTTTPTSATFKLRAGVSCSDGTKLTSQMVADSLTRFLDPKTAAPFLNLLVGGKNPAKVTAPDMNTVKIALQKPWSGLLPGLTSPYTGVICPAGLKNPDSMLTKSFGTGPFVAASQVPGASYTLKRRAEYSWGPQFLQAPKGGTPPQTLVLKVVEDESTRANLMSTGELQISAYGTDAWKRFKGQQGYNVVNAPQADTWLIFNENTGHPTADKSVRKAISQAVDRQRINQIQSFGSGKLISNIGEPSYQCYDPGLDSLLPKVDTAAASAALKGAKIRIIGTNLLAGGDANAYLLAALKAVGANATVTTMNNGQWVSDLFSGKNDWDVTIMVLANTISSFLEAGGFMVGSAPPAGQNLGNTQNPEAETALAEAGANEGAAKCAAISKFQRALLNNNDVLPIATSPVNTVFTGGTSGVVVKGFVRTGTIRVGS